MAVRAPDIAAPIHEDAAGSRARTAFALAGALILAMAAVWALAELVPAVRRDDAKLLARAVSLQGTGLESVAKRVLSPLEQPYIWLWGAAVVAIGLARGLPRLALAAAAVMLLAPASADLLKPLLAHAHDRAGEVRVGAVSWPSGHAAASMGLLCGLAIVVPSRARPYVLSVGGIYSAAVASSLVILAWHMPSDVLGGWLLAWFWTAVAVGVLRLARLRWPERRRW